MYIDTTNVEPEFKIIPVRIGAAGIATKVLRKGLEAIPGKHSIDSLQKTAILRTRNTGSIAA
jgi:hypothetical protein